MVEKERVKGTYQHYKGGFYEVLGVAEEPSSGSRFVVYQALGIAEDLLGESETRILRTGNKGVLAVCSLERFKEMVDGKEYSGGNRVPRFRLIARAPEG